MPKEYSVYLYDEDNKFRGMVRLPKTVLHDAAAHAKAYAIADAISPKYIYEVRTNDVVSDEPV